MGRPFPFARNEQVDCPRYDFVAQIGSGVHSTEELFDEFSLKLKFPSYFGRNWNALKDCLSDLVWLPGAGARVALLHDAEPHLPRNEMALYLSVLADSIVAHEGGSRVLTVAFPEQTKALNDAWSGIKT